MIWEEMSVIGMRYFCIPADSQAPMHNMEVGWVVGAVPRRVRLCCCPCDACSIFSPPVASRAPRPP